MTFSALSFVSYPKYYPKIDENDEKLSSIFGILLLATQTNSNSREDVSAGLHNSYRHRIALLSNPFLRRQSLSPSLLFVRDFQLRSFKSIVTLPSS